MSEQAPAGLPGTPGRAGPVPLRRNRGFRMLWAGQLLSDTGSQMGLIAYPLLILALTRSPVLAGVVGTARETADAIAAVIALAMPGLHDAGFPPTCDASTRGQITSDTRSASADHP